MKFSKTYFYYWGIIYYKWYSEQSVLKSIYIYSIYSLFVCRSKKPTKKNSPIYIYICPCPRPPTIIKSTDKIFYFHYCILLYISQRFSLKLLPWWIMGSAFIHNRQTTFRNTFNSKLCRNHHLCHVIFPLSTKSLHLVISQIFKLYSK